MMKTTFHLLSVIFFLTSSNEAYSLNCEKVLFDSSCKKDTVSLVQIKKSLKKNIALMEKSHIFTIDEIIVLVKLYNTSSFLTVQEKIGVLAERFCDVFYRKYYPEAFEALEFVPLKGLSGGYSKKYDLYLGGLYSNCRSYYQIKGLLYH